jgi:sugar O-acyltransferase (sialic acid O-acetyltransferase NeuD family)
MTNKLAILGAGGHGKVVADAALSSCLWSEVVFFDDGCLGKANNGQWVVEGTGADLLCGYDQFSGVVVAIGNNKLRLAKTLELQRAGAEIVSIIHPSAVVSPFANIAKGCVVFAGAVINIDATIGRSCIVNTGAVVEHDCCLHDGVHLSPNAAISGQTEVGECSWIGIGAVTRESIFIGSDVVVGAGSVIVKNVPNGVTVVGNPAVILK